MQNIENKIQSWGTGHGARAKREAQRERAAAARLEELARASARAWVRAWEAHGGREVGASLEEELAAICHAHAARAWVATGTAPRSRRALWTRRNNSLAFGALLAWHRETRAAGREMRSLMWGGGVERVRVESVDAEEGGWSRLATLAGDGGAPAPIRATARRVRWAREALTVYHVLSGSRQWRASLSDDLAMLRAATEAARGRGVVTLQEAGETLLSGDGDAATGALRQRLSTFRRRLAAGDALMGERPTEAAAALATYYTATGKPGRAARVGA